VKQGRIGIMGAMAQEVGAIAEAMRTERVVHRGGREFRLGELAGRPIVLAMSRCGKVAAATTAAHMLLEHDARAIIFTGLAGAVEPALRVGDIVVADRLWQHDMDASPIFPRLEIPLTGKSWIAADHAWREKLRRAAEALALEELASGPQAAALAALGIRGPRVVVGDVATGDQFIGSPALGAQVRERVPTALCVEMEGGAVAQVCDDHQTPFAAVRTISDSADHAAALDFDRFLTSVTGVYALGVIARALQLDD